MSIAAIMLRRTPRPEASLSVLLNHARRWHHASPSEEVAPEIIAAPPIAETSIARVARQSRPYTLSTLTSLAAHLILCLATAWLAVDSTAPEASQRIVVEAAMLPPDLVSSPEVLMPLVEVSAAAAEVKSDLDTFSTIELDPGAMQTGAPEVQLATLTETWTEATATTPGALEATGSGVAADGSGETGSGGDPAATGTEFFGVQAYGNRFVFVCDCSRSMTGDKWLLLHRELTRCLEALGPDKSYYIIFFDGEMHRMFAPDFLERSLIPATPENVDRTRLWMAGHSLGPNTSPFESIKFALTLDADAIFLLTDGEFNDFTAPYLRNYHKQRRSKKAPGVVVHTIGFYDEKHQRVLKRIAKEAGGTYKFIAGPQMAKPKRSHNPRPLVPYFGPPSMPVRPRNDG